MSIQHASLVAKRRRLAIAAGTWRFREPVGPAIEHVAALRRAGMSAQAIADAAGLPLTVVSMLAWPNRAQPRQWILANTGDALRRVTPADTPDHLKVDATGTRRRIEALQRIGWSGAEIGRRTGVTTQAINGLKRAPKVTAGKARQIAALYDELCMRDGGDKKARTWAIRGGYAPPLAWDEGAIDDPAATPNLGATDSIADRVVTASILDGTAHPTTTADRDEVVPELAARGMSDAEIAALCCVHVRTILRDRIRLDVPSRYAETHYLRGAA